MKPTQETTYLMIAVNVLYTLSVVTSIALRFYDNPVHKGLQVLNEIVYIVPMMYLVIVLKHLKEDESIFRTYQIFIGVDILISMYFVVVKPTANNVGLYYLFFLLSIIAGLIFYYPICPYPKQMACSSLLTYGLMFLFITLLQLVASVVYSSTMFKYISLTEILIPATTFYILFKIARYLDEQRKSDSQIAQFGDNPGNI